jgi:ribonuclease HI
MSTHAYNIWTDGGARGNPGPAAYGFVIKGLGTDAVRQGEAIGRATNNVAEYTGVVEALRALARHISADEALVARVTVYADSELLVKQMNGIYRVKDARLRELHADVRNEAQKFGAVLFVHVRRGENKEADRLVNMALDRD